MDLNPKRLILINLSIAIVFYHFLSKFIIFLHELSNGRDIAFPLMHVWAYFQT